MITAGVSRVASGLLCVHAIAITPAGPMELVRSSFSIANGLPCEKVRSAPAIIVSGPAQRSLSLWPARSRSRLATLFIESSDGFVAFAAALDCYRAERSSSRAGVSPAEVQRLSRRTFSPIGSVKFATRGLMIGSRCVQPTRNRPRRLLLRRTFEGPPRTLQPCTTHFSSGNAASGCRAGVATR